MLNAEEAELFGELDCGLDESPFDEPEQSGAPSGDSIAVAKAEAKQYAAETGRPVTIHEQVIEESNGTCRRTFGWRTDGAAEKGDAVTSTVELLLAAGVEPVREEDGVVRLLWPPLDDALPDTDWGRGTARAGGRKGGATNPPQDSKPRKHIEPTAYPIRSPETASLILFFLFEQKQKYLAPRELKQTAMILEGQALRRPQPLDLSAASLRSPILEVLLLYLRQFPYGWKDTATLLLESLEEYCELEQLGYAKSPDWPQNARSLSRQLRLVEPWLAEAGYELTFSCANGIRNITFLNPEARELKRQREAERSAEELDGSASSQPAVSAGSPTSQTEAANSAGSQPVPPKTQRRKPVPPTASTSSQPVSTKTPVPPRSDRVPPQLAEEGAQSSAANRDFSEAAKAAVLRELERRAKLRAQPR